MPVRLSSLFQISLAFLVVLGGVLYTSQLHAEDVSDLYRKEPQRKYEGAVSFFFVHGYATAFYQDFEDDFSTTESNGQPLLGVNPGNNQPSVPGSPSTGAGLIGRPGNITMANSGGDGTFQHDVGLIIGAEINPQLKLLTEQHWINTNADGGSNNAFASSSFKEIATTQAKIRWKPFEDKPFQVTAGRFWTSFGGYAQDELLSAQNRFSQVPIARYTMPYAINEGLQIDGAHKLVDGTLGMNWTLEVGNGNNAFDKPIGGTFDSGNGKDLIGRVGLIPTGLIGGSPAEEVEFGLSYADGSLREGAETANQGTFVGRFDPSNMNHDNPVNFNAEYDAYGLDARYITPGYDLKAYWLQSEEKIENGPDLERTGLFAEATYEIIEELGVLGSTDAKIRYDSLERDALSVSRATNAGVNLDDNRTYEDEKLSYGLEFHPQDQLRMGIEYHTSEEGGAYANEVDDDGFTVTTTASF